MFCLAGVQYSGSGGDAYSASQRLPLGAEWNPRSQSVFGPYSALPHTTGSGPLRLLQSRYLTCFCKVKTSPYLKE